MSVNVHIGLGSREYKKTGNRPFDQLQATHLGRQIRNLERMREWDLQRVTDEKIGSLQSKLAGLQDHGAPRELSRSLSNESALGLSRVSSSDSYDSLETDSYEIPRIDDQVVVYKEFESAVIQDYHNRVEWLQSLHSEDDEVGAIIQTLIDTEHDRFQGRETEYQQHYELLYRPRDEAPLLRREYSSKGMLLLDYQYKIREQNCDRIWALRSLNIDESLSQYVEELIEYDRKEFQGENDWIESLAQPQNASLSRSESSSSCSSSNFSMDADELEVKFVNAILQAYRSRIDWLQGIEVGQGSLNANELIQTLMDRERNLFEQKEESFLSENPSFYDRVKVLETRHSEFDTVDEFIQSYCQLIKGQQEERRTQCVDIIEHMDAAELVRPGIQLIMDDLEQSQRQISMVRQAAEEWKSGQLEEEDLVEAVQKIASHRVGVESVEEEDDFIGALQKFGMMREAAEECKSGQFEEEDFIRAANKLAGERPKPAIPPLKEVPKRRIGFSQIGALSLGVGFAAYHLGSQLLQGIPLPPINFTTDAPLFLSCLGSRVVDVVTNVATPVAQLFSDAVQNFSFESTSTLMKHSIESSPNALAYLVGAIAAMTTIGQYLPKKDVT